MQLTSWSIIFKSLYRVFSLRHSLVLALLAFIATGAYNYIETIIPIFTVQALGWTDQAYSQFQASATLIGGMAGMLIGGMLLDKFGKIRMMNIYFFLMITLTTALAFLNMFWTHSWFISSFMIVYQVLYVFASIGLFVIAMQCCWKKVSASQFTLYMTISNLGRIAGAKLIGPVKNQLSWEYTLFLFALMIALSWIIIQFIRINYHVKKVADLENKDAVNRIPALT